jgi:hypothetical protein
MPPPRIDTSCSSGAPSPRPLANAAKSPSRHVLRETWVVVPIPYPPCTQRDSPGPRWGDVQPGMCGCVSRVRIHCLRHQNNAAVEVGTEPRCSLTGNCVRTTLVPFFRSSPTRGRLIAALDATRPASGQHQTTSERVYCQGCGS